MNKTQQRAGTARHSNDNHELRDLRQERAGVRFEKRADDEAGGFIRGLAAVFYNAEDPGTEYWLWDDTVERIHPGAFDRAIKEAHDARGLFNHDSSNLLGRVSSGTCRLSVTTDGLAYEIDRDASDPDHDKVCSKIDRGDVTGSSFAFIPSRVTWEEERNGDEWLYIRNIYDLDLFDVGPVTWPAYEATTAGRSQRSESGADQEAARLVAEREAFLRPADDEAVAMRLRLLETST